MQARQEENKQLNKNDETVKMQTANESLRRRSVSLILKTSRRKGYKSVRAEQLK
jgi:hypothetical protein